jgi:acetoin utilization deacetylase AcuC-like enzyme
MARTAIVVDPEYLKHDPGEFHPERPERICGSISENSIKMGFRFCRRRRQADRTSRLATAPNYVKLVESTSKTNHYALDGDTITCRDSFGVGLLGGGGFCA